jgi:hypothetical protein
LIKVENREKNKANNNFNLHSAILFSFNNYSWQKKIRKAEYISQDFIKDFLDRKFSNVKNTDILNISNYM